jgi:hypothetical protein
MEFTEYVQNVSFRLLQPTSPRPSGFRALNHLARKAGPHLEMWMTRLPEDQQAMQMRLEKVCKVPRMSTFAIGAIGSRTHGITIRHCSWLQDPVPGRIWRVIPWGRIHDPIVDIEHDWRLFDGDFFRGDGIKGGVTIEHCRIGQAFNAIHLFNDHGDLGLARDVVVRDCTFFEIRDNVLEPETAAGNWWCYRNRLFNVHKWFSFEGRQSQYFYIFANLAWFDSIQGPAQGDDNRGGGVFKLAKNVDQPFGPNYVFHNSFVTRSDYARNGILAGMKHFNNAILCVNQAGPDFDQFPNFFGNLAIVHFSVGRLDKAVAVDLREGCQGVDQADVRPFRCFDRADPSVVCRVNVADLKASALPRQTPWPEGGKTSLMCDL